MKRLGRTLTILAIMGVAARAGAIAESEKAAFFQLMLSQIYRCFVPPIDLQQTPVTVEVYLKRDGALSKPRQIVGPQAGS